MQDHFKIVLKGSSNLRCEHPEELHGYSFLKITSQKLCDIPLVIRVAIQDIQTYSVIVSWQSRNQSGLNGYQVAYYGEQTPTIVSSVSKFYTLYLIFFYIHVLKPTKYSYLYI